MTNDNVSPNAAMPSTASVVAIDPRQHVLFRHVLALLEVRRAAAALLDQYSAADYSPDEKMLFQALSNKELQNEDSLLLNLIEQLLLFALPGPDIIADGCGLCTMQNPQGEQAIGIVLTIQPGKQVTKPMRRKTAEAFEAELKRILDLQFGRLIKL